MNMLNKNYIFLFLFVVSGFITQAQQVTFQKTFGGIGSDVFSSVSETSDGGFALIGSTGSFGAGGVYVLKIDVQGNLQWSKAFGGSDIDEGNSIQQTSDGGYILVGNTQSFGIGFIDLYLLKIDSQGNLQWSKTFGGSDSDWAYSVQQTNDGGYALAGHTVSFTPGIRDVFLMKTDSQGSLQWSNTFGGNDDDYCWSMKQTIDGGYIMTGRTESFGIRDVYLIKTDSQGNLQWSKTFGGNSEGYSVIQTSDGGYALVGITSFGSGIQDIYLIKTDSQGSLQWSKAFGESMEDAGISLQQTADRGYAIAGYTLSFGNYYDACLIKTDSLGNIQWSETYGGGGIDLGESLIKQVSDKGFLFAGQTDNFGAGSDDIYLIKTDSIGNSGCNDSSVLFIQTNPPTIESNPATITSIPPTQEYSPSSIYNTPSTITTTLCNTSGVETNGTNDLQLLIHPNPTTGKFNLKANINLKVTRVGIYNAIGREIYSISQFDNREIDLSSEPNGVYFVQIKTAESTAVKKIVVYR